MIVDFLLLRCGHDNGNDDGDDIHSFIKAGSVIAFACGPDCVAADGDGRNGVFTQHLLQHLPTRGLDIEKVLRRVARDVVRNTGGLQEPWRNCCLMVEELCVADDFIAD